MDNADNKKAVWVGIFIAVGLVIFIVAVFTFGNSRKSFSNGVHISAVFNDVNGLMKGNNVWFSGVRVGTISNIRFTGISQVYVTMNIDKNAQQYIHNNAGVKVSSEGFIGNKLLVIEGGSPTAPIIEDGNMLKAESMMTTDDIMKTLQQNNTNLLAITSDFKALSHNIVTGKGLVGQLLTDSVLSLRFKSVVENLNRTTASTARMADQLNQYGVKLNSKDGLATKFATDTTIFKQFQRAVNQLQQTTKTASDFADNLNKASNKLNTTDNAIGVLLNDPKAATKVQNTIEQLQQSSVKLNDDLEAAQHNFFLKGYFNKKDKEQKKIEKQRQDSIEKASKTQ